MSQELLITNGDITLDQGGTPTLIGDELKLQQDIKKIAVTEQGTNKFHPWYGNAIGLSSIGRTNYVFSAIQSIASRLLEDSINNLIQLQVKQRRSQIVTPGETILSVRNVLVEEDPIDPRQINVKITIITQSLQEIEDTLIIRI